MFYNFDPNRWAASLIPKILRHKLLYALIKALLSPVSFLYDIFDAYRSEIERRLAYNAFTIYLEKFLNDLIGTDGIYIVDNIIEQTTYLSHKTEDLPFDYLAMKAENAESVYISNSDRLVGGFTVMVPESVSTQNNIDLIAKWVNYYKYAGTRFNILAY